MLKLSSKYAVEFLRREAIGRLEAHFPPRMNDFKIRGHYSPESHFTQVIGDFETNIALRLDDALEVIVLARLFDIPQILPLHSMPARR